ncbi:MAG: DNA polymerase I [Oscillospiraceae bacterium]|nr:DNA polymerase I [Oscillospiraceae bacterium]
MKLMILDGNSVINRAFYGVRLLSTKKGEYTNAIYGFLNILDRMRQEEAPDALCVAFDLHGPTFRHEKYALYKATRHGMPEELAQQMPVIKDVLRAMNIPIYACQGWEADDVIGTIAKRCSEGGWDCVVVTGDRDSLQLVDEHVTVKLVTTKGGQTGSANYTPALFREEYGFDPIHLIDLKALMGDSSDNIPGVAGVGPKTATELLRKYGTLDGVYENLTPQNMKGKLYEKLETGKENAYLSYDLATIRLNAPVDFAPGDALVAAPDKAALYELFLRLEFVKLIDKYQLRGATVGVASGRPQNSQGSPAPYSAAPVGDGSPVPETISLFDRSGAEDAPASTPGQLPLTAADGSVEASVELSVPESKAEFDALFERWKAAEHVALAASEDLETLALDDGSSPAVLQRACLSPAWDEILSSLFSGQLKLIVHGAKELIRKLLERCLPSEGIVFDAEVAAYLLDAARGKYELSRLALEYCQIQLPTEDELIAKGVPAAGERPSSVSGLEEDARCHLPPKGKALNAQTTVLLCETAALLALYAPLCTGLQEQKLERLYYEMDLPLCRLLAKMEVEGVRVDAEALHRFDEMLKARITEAQADIFRYAGGDFNVNSPKQLGEVLFVRLGLPAGKKTKTGWSTNAEVLEKLRDKHPIVACILEYRTLTKLQATYAEGLLKVIGPDGRVRTTFQNTVTATGRLSSTEPNLQNIPVRTDLGAEIRKMFVPEPGWVFVDADYSQIELRVLAHMADDKAMQAAFLSGEDVHRVTASQVFGVPLEAVTPQMRRNAKAVNFGIVYGISEFSLADDIGVSRTEAKNYIDNYLSKYHGVRDFMAAVVEQATKLGYVSTLYGRRRYLPELKDGKFMVREAAKRMAMNSPIQGTAADIIKLAMLRVDKALQDAGRKARLVLQVHDELIVECPEAEADAVAALVTREMESAAKLAVPLTAEAKTGRSWYEAK